ncbi:MAG: cell envelope integrity protein CreD [Nitrospirae bacterium]|nr:cell envelope integrity protein CreD [Nitrospirota bacterium]
MTMRWRNSAGMRIAVMVLVSFVLILPTFMIQNLVREREMTRNSAVAEVSGKWGGGQAVAGPILTVPLKKQIKDDKGKVTGTSMRYAHFLPDNLSVNGTIYPHVRHRGIYDMALYNSKLAFSGIFSQPDFDGLGIDGEEIIWKDASLGIGITDMKGIKETIAISWNDTSLTAGPGIESPDILCSGVSTPIVLDKTARLYPFSFAMDLNGSQELKFLPLGRETKIILSSTWSNPSFQGSFLPEKREVSNKGFTAEWQVLQLNRNFPQRWIGKQHDIYSSAFGVNLFMPVDQYQKTSRSLKYALLFIGLTFTAYFIIELLNKRSMHPIHYMLVGLALVLFYSLLLSLSEHIGFNYSYLAASFCTIFMITAYTKSVLADKTIAAAVFVILSLLYGFLYVLLQIEDYALLLGSIGLFVILGLVMYLTRKIDWFSAMRSEEGILHE